MSDTLSVLKSCVLFDGIEERDFRAMLGCLGAKQYSYKKGDTILREGDPAKCFGIVLSGCVQIVRIDYYGNRSITAKLEAGEIFGESFACAGVPSMMVDVVATEDSTVLLIDAGRLTHTCSNACDFHNQMIINLLRVVARKNLVFNQKIEVTSKRSTREKLMTYLMLQAKKAGSSTFTIPYDRQELADYLEVERSGLSAEISKLRKEKVLTCEKNKFVLLQNIP